jgi:transposase
MKKTHPPREVLERLYLIEKKSTHEMAEKLGVSQETARKWLIKEGIPIRSQSEAMTKFTKMPTKRWLEDTYLVQEKTARQIGEELGVPTPTVYSWMKKFDIPRRDSYESIVLSGGAFGGANKITPPAKEALYELYVSQRISAPKIGLKYGVSEFTVRRWLMGYDIEIRSQSDAQRVNGDHLDKDWLYDQYVTQKKSTLTLSEETGVSKKTINRTLRLFEIPRRTTSEALRGNKKRSGENNPMWKGGLSSHTKKLRYQAEYLESCRAVRRRDKCCLLCLSEGRDSKGETHEVHHIDPIASALLLVFDIGNMILLCEKCHLKIRGKEKRWMKRLFILVRESEQRAKK